MLKSSSRRQYVHAILLTEQLASSYHETPQPHSYISQKIFQEIPVTPILIELNRPRLGTRSHSVQNPRGELSSNTFQSMKLIWTFFPRSNWSSRVGESHILVWNKTSRHTKSIEEGKSSGGVEMEVAASIFLLHESQLELLWVCDACIVVLISLL